MSGHLRFCFAAFLVLAGFSTSPASSNPFDALFNTAPREATTPAPAEQECLRQPGKATDGQHWVYRLDGPRKCWFQIAERSTTVKRPVQHYAAKQRVFAVEENEAEQPKAVVGDARAEMLPSAQAEMSQLTPSARELKVVDAQSVSATGTAALVQPTPVVAKPATDLPPDYPTHRQVDAETLLVTAPSASDTVASSVPAATPVAVPIAEAGDEERGWTTTWLGVLLMVLGSLLSSSATLQGHRPGPAISRSEGKSAANRRTFSVWDEADQRPDNFHVTRRHSVIVGPSRHSPRSGLSYTPRPNA
jgi:hypothetical protein